MSTVNWLPWHGLVSNGEMQLPFGAGTKEYPDPNETRIGFYGAATAHLGSSFLMRSPGAPESIERSAEEMAADQAAGRSWLPYALMSGNQSAIGGTSVPGGDGDCGWLYFDQTGACWQIKASMSTDGNLGVPNESGYQMSARLNYRVRRFGRFDGQAHVDSDYLDAYGLTELYLPAGQHFVSGTQRIVAKNSNGSKALWGIFGSGAIEATGANQDWPLLWMMATVSGSGNEGDPSYGLSIILEAIPGGQAAAAQYPGTTTTTTTGTSLYGCWTLTKADFPKELSVTWHVDADWCYVPPPGFQPEPNGNSATVTETIASHEVKLWGVFGADDVIRWLTATSAEHYYYSLGVVFTFDGPTSTREGESTAFQKATRTRTVTLYGFTTRTRHIEFDGNVLWHNEDTELNPANYEDVTTDQMEAIFGDWYSSPTCHNVTCANGSANSAASVDGYPSFDYWTNGLIKKPDGTYWRYFAVRYSDQVIGAMEVAVAVDGSTWTSATLHGAYAPDASLSFTETAVQFLVQPMKYSGGSWSGKFASWHPVAGTISMSDAPLCYV